MNLQLSNACCVAQDFIFDARHLVLTDTDPGYIDGKVSRVVKHEGEKVWVDGDYVLPQSGAGHRDLSPQVANVKDHGPLLAICQVLEIMLENLGEHLRGKAISEVPIRRTSPYG